MNCHSSRSYEDETTPLRNRHQLKRPQHGFTLIEILVAMSLAAMLMTGVWMIVDNQRQLQIKANRQALKARVVRGLRRQFKADLQRLKLYANGSNQEKQSHSTRMKQAETALEQIMSFAEPTSNRERAVGVQPQSRTQSEVFFMGTPTQMVFEVPRENMRPQSLVTQGGFLTSHAPTASIDGPPVVNGLIDSSGIAGLPLAGLPLEGSFASSAVPPMEHVRYEFQSPINRLGIDGLSFRDQPERTSARSQSQTADGIGGASTDQGVESLRANKTQLVRSSGLTERQALGSLPDVGMMAPEREFERSEIRDDELGLPAEPFAFEQPEDQVPEVIWCRFYYYNGLSWRTEWNADLDGGLPCAVAMHLVVSGRPRSNPSEAEQALQDASVGEVGSSDSQNSFVTNEGMPDSRPVANDSFSADEFNETTRPEGDYYRIICPLVRRSADNRLVEGRSQDDESIRIDGRQESSSSSEFQAESDQGGSGSRPTRSDSGSGTR